MRSEKEMDDVINEGTEIALKGASVEQTVELLKTRYELNPEESEDLQQSLEGYELADSLLRSYPKEWFDEWVQTRVLKPKKE